MSDMAIHMNTYIQAETLKGVNCRYLDRIQDFNYLEKEIFKH